MFKKLQLFFTAVVILVFSTASWSQKSLAKAQRQFELKAFDLAIENAKKAITKKPDCVECHSLIAESFRMMNANVDAAIWYRKMEKFDNLPQDWTFNYGLLLKRMGQYDKAQKYFNLYAKVDEDKANYFAESCEFAKTTLSAERDFELNLYNASSKKTDFGPSIFRDKVVFASFRDDFKRDLDKINTSQIQRKGCQLFIGGSGVTGDVNSVNFLMKENDHQFDFGPIHYAQSAPKCVVTRNNFNDGEKQVFSNDLELSLLIGKVNPDGSFTDLEAFPFNEVGYATGFGTLNPAGNILYFSSNRPGGLGGFDLYVSYYKDGAWTYPENLGKKVNTEGNEVTPFFDGENLYYSSDFTTGIGGFDVFKTSVGYGEWNTPNNMGNGVNSPEDDYYFVKHPEKNSYYLTSNRLGGRGSHDIYLVHKATPAEEILVEMVDFEDVIPAAVNLDEDIVEDDGREAISSTVSLNESAPAAQPAEAIPAAVSIAEDIPAAVEIENTTSTTQDMNESGSDFKSDEGVVDFNKLLPPKAVDLNKMNSRSVSLVGAKRVAFGEIIHSSSNVYFIQLAALFKNKADLRSFMPLKSYGSIYKVQQSNATKVKLGYFMDEYQAKETLRNVKQMGFSDAFITYEALNTNRMELVELSHQTTDNYQDSGYNTNTTTGVNYKIRLASYEDPIYFDIEKVNDLGVIEQWSKGDWTIFVLSGFNSLAEAEMAKLNVENRGFSGAELVVDRNGILEKIK